MLKILFVCTHNRCRSILCEALARHLGAGRIDAYSAGSQPVDCVHPDTLEQLEQRGIDTSGLKSESWNSYEALAPDAVITVCDSAAGESCPLWLGNSLKVHWGLPDPSRVDGSGGERIAAFDNVITTIERRLNELLKLECEKLSGPTLEHELRRIAEDVPHA